MKKAVVCLLSLISLIAFALFCACTPKTEFDDKEILKITTSQVEGLAPFPRSFERTFDFKTGKVTDTWVTDLSILDKETLSQIDKKDYNNPKLVTTFSEEQADEFLAEVKSLGLYTWEENYITQDVVDDGGSSSLTIYFADGTKKSTYIYFEYPPKYDKIKKAFENYLGAGMYT